MDTAKMIEKDILFLKNNKEKTPPLDFSAPEVIVYIGDVNSSLHLLPDASVDCVVTSPPYWKQRDYKHPQQIGQEHNYHDYINKLAGVFNEIKRVLKPTGTLFLNIGYKYQNKELILIPELLAIELQKNGWALLNKIIWSKPNAMPSSLENRFSNVYEPVFLFVKKTNKFNYYLSLDKLRVPLSNTFNKRNPEEILGFEVENSLLKNRKEKGRILRAFKAYKNYTLAEVCWNNGRKTLEIVQDFNKESQIPVELLCSDCGGTIKSEIDVDNHSSCKGFPKPILPPKLNFAQKEEVKSSFLFSPIDFSLSGASKNNYKGKFKLDPKNRGASPGARKSLFGEYFILQRRYKIFQSLVSEYLKFWKNKRGLTIKQIDTLLGYKDTAGHWFRRDSGSWGKGGSIPLPEDWFKLKEILKFDSLYDRWVTETHLVLQTVRPHPKGKNPGDVWNIKIRPFSEAHFATFPEELVEKCILAGCPEGGTVLDPFAGSGTVGEVAYNLGRNAVLIELVPEYINIIKKRCPKIKEIIYVK
ncbi:MAG: site-specific DNA-methyltransferase [Candidatus Omnitrophica bacterium]|nr:site-specific DNA-methyltransferase [Candidatus Omnitrophota bacterium]